MKNSTGELFVSLGLLVLLFIMFNPWQLFMPGYMVMGLMVAIVVLFVVFATFFWREGEGDEREEYHRLIADRVAYLAGSGALLLGVIISEWRHDLDIWLIGALAIMIVAKVAGLLYSKTKL
jgi:hypothetical protein